MATNKERTELLEAGLGSLQDGMNRMELGINDRLHHLEETLNKLTETIMASKGAAIQIAHDQSGSSRPNCKENEGGPISLKEAISLAQMRDEQMIRQRETTRPFNRTVVDFSSSTKFKPTTPIKRLTWDEMQTRRAQRLCFNCEEKFTLGRRCTGPQLLLLERRNGNSDEVCECEP
ncbi:hypothetical protein KPL70_023603 [Citrus sinensis]|nr:hypothetical protein KPL70_023603 [Citrus sinensis]